MKRDVSILVLSEKYLPYLHLVNVLLVTFSEDFLILEMNFQAEAGFHCHHCLELVQYLYQVVFHGQQLTGEAYLFS
jgi:hypothetical protein